MGVEFGEKQTEKRNGQMGRKGKKKKKKWVQITEDVLSMHLLSCDDDHTPGGLWTASVLYLTVSIGQRSRTHGLAGVSAQGHARLKVSAGWAAFPDGALGPLASSFSLLQNSLPCHADWGPRTQLLEGTFRSQPQGPLTAQTAHLSKVSQRCSLLWEPQGSLTASNLIKGRLSHSRHRPAPSRGGAYRGAWLLKSLEFYLPQAMKSGDF